jgi:hypothetical protein
MTVPELEKELSNDFDDFKQSLEEAPVGQITFHFGVAVKVISNHRENELKKIIFQVGDTIFEMEGDYSSWDDFGWDDARLYVVEPVQVTNTEYKRKLI